jgi:predicted ester cyclase
MFGDWGLDALISSVPWRKSVADGPGSTARLCELTKAGVWCHSGKYDDACGTALLEGGNMEDALEVARRYDEAFNNQDPEARKTIEAADIEMVLPGDMTLRGPDEVLGVVRAFWEALPDGKITTDNDFASENMVLSEGTLAGTHSGIFRTPQGEVPPSGNAVKLRFASVKRIENDKLVSEHLYFDQLEFLRQIGALPPSE